MKFKRSSLLVLIVCILSIGVFNLFAGGQAEQAKKAQPERLTIMMHPVLYDATGGEGGQIDKFVKETGIQVDVVTGPLDQIMEKTLLDFVSGSSSIDIFSFTDTAIHPGLADFLLPLDSYVANAGAAYQFEDILSGPLEIGKLNGKLYGIPFRIGSYMLYYRTDLFEKYGVKVPETWDEFLNAAKLLTEGLHADGFLDSYGLAYTAQTGQYIFENYKSWLAGFGGVITDNKGNVKLTDPAAVNALKAYMEPYRNKWASPNSPAQSIDEVIAAFQAGKAGMVLVYSPYWGLFTNPATSTVHDKVGWALTPHAPGVTPGRSSISGWHLLVNKKTEFPDAAWKLVQYLTNVENMYEQAAKYSNGPVRNSVLLHPEYLEKFSVAEGWAKSLQASEPLLPGGHEKIGEIMDIISRELSNAFLNIKTPEVALRDAQNQLQVFF